jgi:glycosyltransferase involved in cell wall biosynthesis
MLRVLLSACACEPDRGSEPAVGWNWVRQIARFHEVWVITRTNNRQFIEATLATGPIPNAHFVYFDLPGWRYWSPRPRETVWWKRRGWLLPVYYYLWQVGIYFLARTLRRHVKFDLVHHVTWVNYWIPSFLSMLPLPFVLGPVGGGESAPPTFWRSFSLRGKVYEALRDWRRGLGELDPFVRLAARKAIVALATTEQTAERLRRLGSRNVSVLSQVAMTTDEIRRVPRAPARQARRFRVVSAGRFLHWKGFEFGLHAFALFRARFPESEYWLIGDGPEKQRLRVLTGQLGLTDTVRFLGTMTRSQVLEALGACDVLLNPSLHDSGGYVCIEAMAVGLPVVCLDIGGPALQVTGETGVKVPATSRDQVIRDLAAAMSDLARDPIRRAQLSKAARKRVRENFSWDCKGDLIAQSYSQIVLRGQEVLC